MAARDSAYFVEMQKPGEGPLLDLWKALDHARRYVSTGVCYRSVLGDHWITTSDDFRPRQVDSCDALPGPAFKE